MALRSRINSCAVIVRRPSSHHAKHFLLLSRQGNSLRSEPQHKPFTGSARATSHRQSHGTSARVCHNSDATVRQHRNLRSKQKQHVNLLFQNPTTAQAAFQGHPASDTVSPAYAISWHLRVHLRLPGSQPGRGKLGESQPSLQGLWPQSHKCDFFSRPLARARFMALPSCGQAQKSEASQKYLSVLEKSTMCPVREATRGFRSS